MFERIAANVENVFWVLWYYFISKGFDAGFSEPAKSTIDILVIVDTFSSLLFLQIF